MLGLLSVSQLMVAVLSIARCSQSRIPPLLSWGRRVRHPARPQPGLGGTPLGLLLQDWLRCELRGVLGFDAPALLRRTGGWRSDQMGAMGAERTRRKGLFYACHQGGTAVFAGMRWGMMAVADPAQHCQCSHADSIDHRSCRTREHDAPAGL